MKVSPKIFLQPCGSLYLFTTQITMNGKKTSKLFLNILELVSNAYQNI